MSRGDLVWLHHVPVVGEWGEEERVDFASTMRLHDLVTSCVIRSLLHTLDSPGIEGVRVGLPQLLREVAGWGVLRRAAAFCGVIVG